MGSALLSLETKQTAQVQRMVQYNGTVITVHADSASTGGRFALLEVSGTPGGEPPLHVHRNEDEMFYVLEGEMQIFRGHEMFIIGPGQSALLPRDVPHTFKVLTAHAHALIFITPGGFEDYFFEAGRAMQPGSEAQDNPKLDPAKMMEIASRRYGVTFLR